MGGKRREGGTRRGEEKEELNGREKEGERKWEGKKMGSVKKRSLRDKRCEWKKGEGQRERKWKGGRLERREGKS